MKKILICIIILLTVTLGYILFSYKNKVTFKVPKFDNNVSAIPEKIEDEYYSTLDVNEGFSIGINAILKVDSKQNAIVNLTSNKNNKVYIKLRLLDSHGMIIGQTGLIKPGEYLEKIELKKKVNEKDKFTIKVMSYDPKTYYSMSAVKLSVSLKVIENE